MQKKKDLTLPLIFDFESFLEPLSKQVVGAGLVVSTEILNIAVKSLLWLMCSDATPKKIGSTL